MHLAVEGQMLGQGQGSARGYQTLHRRVIRQVEEHRYAGERATLREGIPKIGGDVIFNAHSSKDDHKLLRFGGLFPNRYAQRRLAYDLGSQLVVRQPGCRKQRQLLASQERVHPVDGRDTGLDVVHRVDTCSRVDRLSIDVGVAIGQRIRSAIHRFSQPIEDTSEHLFGHRNLVWPA